MSNFIKQMVEMMATGIVVGCMAAGIAFAEAQEASGSATNARLLECDRLADAEARLECFNNVVRGLSPEPAPAQEEQAEARPAENASPQVAPVKPAGTPRRPMNNVPDKAEVEAAPVITASAEGGSESNDDIVESAPDASRASEDAPDTVQATIVEVRTMSNGRFEAHLDNGQVWRETETSRVRTPKVGSSVVITKGRLGSYRMKIDNNNRRAGVRRTQ